MEICKNKNSNKYFIYVQDTGNTEILLVTPDAQVKSLKKDLFEEIEEQEESYIGERNLLTEDQVKRFHEFEQSRSDEIVEHTVEMINELSPHDKKRLLQRLQKMLGDK